MIEGVRRLLTSRPRAPVERLVGSRPHYIVKREGDQWGVVVLHAGKQIDFLSPKEARRLANKLVDLAWLAAHPGDLPQENCG
jgi:hypothetical protein